MYNIYVIINKINNKLYVGQTNNIKRRWRNHKYESNRLLRGIPLKRKFCAINYAMAKYGVDNFEIEVISSTQTLDDANNEEIFFIEYLNSRVPFGYNVAGGGKNSLVSTETREKISIANKGKISPNKFFSKDQEFDVIKLYNNFNTAKSIAEIYGCEKTIILDVLRKHGISTRKKNILDITAEQKIINLYLNEKINKSQIANIFNCSINTITRILSKNNVKLRSHSESARLAVRRPTDKFKTISINDKLDIVEAYCNGQTITNLSKLFKYSIGLITDFLNFSGVNRRSIWQTRIINDGKLNKIYSDKFNIIHLYINKKLSILTISSMYNCSETLINNILSKNNILKRNGKDAEIKRAKKKNKYVILQTELYKLYIEDKLSCKDIALIYGCSSSLIEKKLKEYGIPTRNLSEARALVKASRAIHDENSHNIIKLYLDDKLSIIKIAMEYNCNESVIRRILKKNNIILRTRQNDRCSTIS